jgi:hypothetical protein
MTAPFSHPHGVDDETASQKACGPSAGFVGREGNTTKNAIYSWQAAYRSAVLETNPKQLAIRINEARMAIEERLRKSIQTNILNIMRLKMPGAGLPSSKPS